MGKRYTTNEAANILRVSPRTLEKWRVTGKGPSFLKLGKLVFYSENAIENWIAAQSRKSTSDPGQTCA